MNSPDRGDLPNLLPRREFLKLMLLAGGSLLINPILAACSGAEKKGNDQITSASEKTEYEYKFDDDFMPDSVYQDKAVGIRKGQIVMLDLKTNDYTQIALAAGKSSPRIFGDNVIWLDEREQQVAGSGLEKVAGSEKKNFIGQDIFVYNLQTKKETRLTNSAARRYNLVLSGHYVAWLEQRGDLTPANYRENELHAFDITTGREIFPSTVKSAKYDLRLKGDKLIWADSRHGHERRDIYMYDLSKGQERALVKSPDLKADPDLDGDNLVWIDYTKKGDKIYSEIYLMDLKTNQQTQLTSSPGNNIRRARIYKDTVLWTARVASDLIEPGASSNRGSSVFMLDTVTKQTTMLTNKAAESGAEVYDNFVLIPEGNLFSSIKPQFYGLHLR